MEPLEVGWVVVFFVVVIGHGWPLPGGNLCIHSEGLGVSSEDAKCIRFLLLQ